MSNRSTSCRHNIKKVPTQTVVGVDQPVRALTCKKIKKNCLSSHSCHFVKKFVVGNNISSCKCPMGLHHVDIISKVPTKSVVGVDRPITALSSLYKSHQEL